MKAVKKTPNPVDVHVGTRVRLRRMMAGFSQEKLGEKLGLTFQQIQKYEKGTNRISASRMQQICEILGTPVSYFFEDLPVHGAEAPPYGFAEEKGPSYAVDFLTSSEGLQLTKAFMRIKDAKKRRKAIDLIQMIAETDD